MSRIDAIGQLKTARGTESDGTTARLNQQFGYAYDQAWNLNRRTNNAMVQPFNVDNLNEQTNATRSGTLTMAGLASERKALYAGDYGVTNVTIDGTGLTTGNAELALPRFGGQELSMCASGSTKYR